MSARKVQLRLYAVFGLVLGLVQSRRRDASTSSTGPDGCVANVNGTNIHVSTQEQCPTGFDSCCISKSNGPNMCSNAEDCDELLAIGGIIISVIVVSCIVGSIMLCRNKQGPCSSCNGGAEQRRRQQQQQQQQQGVQQQQHQQGVQMPAWPAGGAQVGQPVVGQPMVAGGFNHATGQPIGVVQPVQPMLAVTVPPGIEPGAMLMITTPTGQQLQVQVPAGTGPGSVFNVQVPPSTPQPIQATVVQATAARVV
jgi:hypothetical protein